MLVQIQLPDDYVNYQTSERIERELPSVYALWLFQSGMVTLSKAAKLAGLALYDFMQFCSVNQVPVIDISKEELAAEVAGMRISGAMA